MKLIGIYTLKTLMSYLYPCSFIGKDVVEREGEDVVSPPVLQLSAERLSRQGIYLMDYGKVGHEPNQLCMGINKGSY